MAGVGDRPSPRQRTRSNISFRHMGHFSNWMAQTSQNPLRFQREKNLLSCITVGKNNFPLVFITFYVG